MGWPEGVQTDLATSWNLSESLKILFLFHAHELLPACVYECLVPWRPDEGIGSSGTGVTPDCELPCGCWKLNLDPSARAASALNWWTISLATPREFKWEEGWNYLPFLSTGRRVWTEACSEKGKDLDRRKWRGQLDDFIYFKGVWSGMGLVGVV